MADSDYKALLRDPRWQRKRLEIMKRDDFKCRGCGDATSNLQIHHKKYERGKPPWEIDSRHLVTLCEGCHVKEGFRLVEIGPNEVMFRVTDGILVDSECNNGAMCWVEPNREQPNASVSRSVLDGGGPAPREHQERKALIADAIRHLIDNCINRPAT